MGLICVQTNHTLTDWRTTHEAQGCSRRKGCFFFSFTDVTWTFQQFLASGPQLHYTHMSITSENEHRVPTVRWLVHLSESGAAKAQTAKLSGLHLCSSPDLSLLSSSHFPATSFLLASPSLSLLDSLQETAKLHCLVTLTSWLEWHTGYNLTA